MVVFRAHANRQGCDVLQEPVRIIAVDSPPTLIDCEDVAHLNMPKDGHECFVLHESFHR